MIYPPVLPRVTTRGTVQLQRPGWRWWRQCSTVQYSTVQYSAAIEARLEVVEAAVMMKFYDLRKRLCEERDISDLHCSGPGDDAGTVQITAFTRRIEVRPGVCEYKVHPQFWHQLHHLLITGITYML